MNSHIGSNRFDHPLYRPLWLQFKTPQVIALDKKVRQWIYSGITGGIILGDSRVGKSTAVEMLYQNYQVRGKNQPIFCQLFIVPDRDKSSIASIYRELIVATNKKIRSSHSTEQNVADISEYLMDRAMLNDDRVVMLWVDEFQKLHVRQMEIFVELHNRLRREGVTLFVFFIGNSLESSNLLEQSKKDRYAHIHGRFFTQVYRFDGITSKEQLKTCLRQYDTTVWPENGPTYTEFFLPNDFKKGWRMADQADLLWPVFLKYRKQLKFRGLGMKYLVGTVNPLLMDYLPKYKVNKLNENMVDRCIEVSGLLPSYETPTK